MHQHPQTVEHEPSGFLGNSNSAVNLVGGNAVPTIGEHPQSAKPLIQTDRGILENRSDLDRELLLAGLAEPDFAGRYKAVFVGLATRARHLAIWPAKVLRILKAAVRIAEVDDGFLQCVRRFHS
ncbi:MAG TPA: hypothetical protein VNU92_07835 [Edaphobacter sp.]|nr:hypothetical protein [Edaphobacter sp.]